MALRGTLTHRKTRRLAVVLGIPQSYAIGILEALWHVTAEQTPRGDIGRLKNIDIAAEMFHPENDAESLISALVESGWLDRSSDHRLIVHDWSCHADDATDMRLARSGFTYADGRLPRMTKLSTDERARVCARYSWSCPDMPRKATTGHKVALPEPVPEPVPDPDPDPVPDPELKQKTLVPLTGDVEVKVNLVPKSEREFEEDWPYFWAKVGKGAARKAYVNARKKIARDELLTAVKGHGPQILSRAQSQGITPIHPATWLNQERWTDEEIEIRKQESLIERMAREAREEEKANGTR